MKFLKQILALVLIAIMVNSNMISLNALAKRSRSSISRLGLKRNHRKSKTSNITMKEYGLFFLNVIAASSIPVVSDIADGLLKAKDLGDAITTGDTCTVEALGKVYSDEVNSKKIAKEEIENKNNQNIILLGQAFEHVGKEDLMPQLIGATSKNQCIAVQNYVNAIKEKAKKDKDENMLAAVKIQSQDFKILSEDCSTFKDIKDDKPIKVGFFDKCRGVWKTLGTIYNCIKSNKKELAKIVVVATVEKVVDIILDIFTAGIWKIIKFGWSIIKICWAAYEFFTAKTDEEKAATSGALLGNVIGAVVGFLTSKRKRLIKKLSKMKKHKRRN